MHSSEPRWRRYLRFWGPDTRRDADDELAFHFETHVEDLIRSGAGRDSAEAEARRIFGDVDGVRRELYRIGRQRSARRACGEAARHALADLRIALRTLARRPAYALAATLTLSLGVGAAAAVYSVLDGILLRPLPYPESERLVVLWERNVPRARARNVVSVPAFEQFREQSTSYLAVAGLVPHRSTLTEGQPERVYGAEVSPEWFDVMGVRPRIGRGFTAADAVAEPRPIVLSDGLWRDRFGGDAGVVGRAVAFGDAVYRVAGVMPETFEPPAFGWLEEGQRYWVPFIPDPDNRQWGRFLLVLGRLHAGVSVATADAEIERIASGPAPFDEAGDWTADVIGLRHDLTGELRPQALAVAVAVGLLLLITIANVANVVLVRARGRNDELSVRAVLGATRGRIARQLLAEGAAITLLSLPLALLIGALGVYGARRLLPAGLPRLDDVALSWPAIAVCGGVLAFATVAVGLAPLLSRRAGPGANVALQRIVTGRGGGLLVAELAFAVALTAVAVLATRSLLHARAIDAGYDADQLVAARLSLLDEDASDDAHRLAGRALQDLLARQPAIAESGLVSYRPLTGGNPATGVVPYDAPAAEPIVSDVLVATGGYFRAAGIDVLQGREFADDDGTAAPLPVLINESLARQLADVGSIGSRITVHLADPFLEGSIVGIVSDVRLGGPLVEPRAAVYFRHRDWPVNTVDVVARATTSTTLAAAAIRNAVRELDPRIAIWDEAELGAALRSATARERALALVLSLFSAVALLLAAAGMYAAAAVRAAARRREFGLRIALGATPLRLTRSVLGEVLLLCIPGVLLGTAVVFAAAELLRSVLHGIEPTDPVTLVAVSLLLIAVTLLASALPAWRAGRILPGEALRV